MFDLVNHEKLLLKLVKVSVDSATINWIAAFLRGRMMRVNLDLKCLTG